jgi:hypothetical protein
MQKKVFLWGLFTSCLMQPLFIVGDQSTDDAQMDVLFTQAITALEAQESNLDDDVELLRRPLTLEEQKEMFIQQQFQDACLDHARSQRTYFIMKAIGACALTVLSGSLVAFYAREVVKKIADR